MQCDDFQDRWQTLLDERRSVQDDNLLAAHAAECPDCRELLEIQSLLFDEIERTKHSPGKKSSSLKSTPAKSGFDRQQVVPVVSAIGYANAPLQTDEILPTRISARRQTSPGSGLSRRQIANAWVIGLAVAGAVLVAVIPVWNHSSATRSSGTNRSVATNSSPHMPTTLWVASSPAGSSSNVAASTSQADVAAAVPSPAEQEALRNLMQQMSDNFSHVPEKQLDHIAGGLRPLADTLGAALDALRRSIPVSRSQSPNEPQAIFSWASPISPV